MTIDYAHAQPSRKATRIEPPPALNVCFVLVPDFALMTYSAAVEPLRAANTISGRSLYRWWHAAPGNVAVQASNGLTIHPDIDIGSRTISFDWVMVCAGGNPSAFDDARLSSWLRQMAANGTIIAGLSGGPYVLARAGLLSRTRCTLHWEHIPAFRERYPDIEVVRSLFEIEPGRMTCSGGIASLDLMLHLIGLQHGYSLAAAVGDWFLHNQIREGLAPQRMGLQQRFDIRDPRILRVLSAMESHLERPLSREALADLSRVGIRQLERLFKERMGTSLHQHYVDVRLDRAQQLRRETTMPTAEIAVATGFVNADELTRAERRRRKAGSHPSNA